MKKLMLAVTAILVSGLAATSHAAYDLVEWIQANPNATAWINTRAAAETDHATYEIQWTEPTAEAANTTLFGSSGREGGATAFGITFRRRASKYIGYWIGDGKSRYLERAGYTPTSVNYASVAVDGNVISSGASSATFTGSSLDRESVGLFASFDIKDGTVAQNGGKEISKYTKLFLWRMTDGGEVKRAMLPAVERGTGRAGMADLVTGQFFGSDGTGEFTAGPVVTNSVEQLTEKQQALLADMESSLRVVGSHGAIGSVEPAYGWHFGLNDGDGRNLSVASGSSVIDLADNQRACCTGLVVRISDPRTGLVTDPTLVTSFPYVYEHHGQATAEWLWRVENGVVATVSGSGAVLTEAKWATPESLSYQTLTARPADPAVFVRWTGDVPPELAFDPTIALDLTKPRRVTAIFAEPVAFHVASDGDDASATGEESKPFGSVAGAVAAAKSAYGADSTKRYEVVISDGTYETGSVVVDFPLVLRSAGGLGTVTLKATTTQTASTASVPSPETSVDQTLLNLFADGIVVDGLEFTPMKAGTSPRAIWSSNAVCVVNCRVRDWGTPGSTANGIVRFDGPGKTAVMRRCEMISCTNNGVHPHPRYGVVYAATDVVIDGCVFSNCTATAPRQIGGAAVYFAGYCTNAVVRNTLIAKCKATKGQAINMGSSGILTFAAPWIDADIENVTMVDGSANYGESAGISATAFRALRVRNCLFNNNVSSAGILHLYFAGCLRLAATFDNCGWDVVPDGLVGSRNILAEDPFEDGSYGLKASPAVDSGLSLPWAFAPGALDVGGNARRVGSRVDLGCFERQSSELLCSFVEPNDTELDTPGNVTYHADVNDPSATTEWTLCGTGLATPQVFTGTTFSQDLPSGLYWLTVRATSGEVTVRAVGGRRILIRDPAVVSECSIVTGSKLALGHSVPEVVNCRAGELVTLTATPDDGAVFVRWEGGGADVSADWSEPTLRFYATAGETTLMPVFMRAETVHVATDGSDAGGDGSSAAPYRTVGKALEEVADGYDETVAYTVLVAPGTYTNDALVIETPLTLRADGAAGCVTLVATNASPLVTVAAAAEWTVIDGFNLESTRSASQAAVSAICTDARSLVRNCRVADWKTGDCACEGVFYNTAEGSVFCNCSFERCRLRSNSITPKNGIIHSILPAIVTGCSFRKCYLGTGRDVCGTGVYISSPRLGSLAVVRNCEVVGGQFERQRVADGGGCGGGVCLSGANLDARVENVTVADGTDNGKGVGGLAVPSIRSLSVVNCVFVGNSNSVGVAEVSVPAGVTFTRCVTDTALLPGTDNIVADRKVFRNADRGKYSPSASGGLVNTGVLLPWMAAPATDVLGRPRIYGSKPDIGAEERQSGTGLLLTIQ